MKKIIIIGAGPSGMMAAISAKEHHPNYQVILIERNDELGKKLKITGGGRCNITADVPDAEVVQSVPKNGKFLYSALSQFNTSDIQNFFEENGCPLKVEDHHRVLPVSNKSKDIIATLQNKLEQLGIEIRFNTVISSLNHETKLLYLEGSESALQYDYLIITTGGRTYPQTGSDGTGYELAKAFGHTITQLLPAEVPLVSNDTVIADKALQGLSFQDVALTTLNDKNKKVITITHDLLFTHFGISGPAALRTSFYVQKLLTKQKTCKVTIDFLPQFNQSELLQFLKNDTLSSTNLPKRLLTYIESLVCKDTDAYIQHLKAFPITIYETRGFQQAFVTNGGVSLKEVVPQTMHSKLDDSLAFAGEVLDISGFTGGFNITIALSTGYTAGKFIVDTL